MPSLRLLTYNTQLRSWAMEVGASPGYTIPPVDTAEERANLIGDAIVASSFDYDIVALCEVFDEDARLILRKKLDGRFPYQVTKVDYDHVRVDNGTGSTQNLGLLGLWELVGLPVAIKNSYRFEDGGLMLFSRWPFATMSTAGLDPGTAAILQVAGMKMPATIPVVDFLPYTDTEGNDGGSCKGVLYARIQRDPSTTYHVFSSHTQADTNVLEEHKGARSKQIALVEKFIEVCTGGAPFHDEVFFMGDLNIFGEQANTARPGFEWKTYFGTPGRTLTDAAVDLWGRKQCTGEPGGLRDPGSTASVRYHPHEQRLDYIFASATSRLAAQHIMVDYELATVPPGHDEVSYLSDHRPLRLDLATPRPHSTPDTALEPVFPPPPNPPTAVDNNQLLMAGQVKWYRINTPGTYDFDLRGGNACGMAVYLDTDMSRPRQQYRTESDPEWGKKFVLASAPFLIKVYPYRRDSEFVYTLRMRRHVGSGPEDAIQLPYGVTVSESFPSGGQRLNNDNPGTPWDDTDTKWFRLDAPLVKLSRPLDATITVELQPGTAETPFGIAVARRDGIGVWTLLDRQGPGELTYTSQVSLELDDVVYVQVQRADGMTPADLAVSVTVTTKLSILLGGGRGAPRLMCQDETSGWGADDIELKITVDGVLLRHISNDEIGDMEQDAIRDLDQWIPALVPYFDGIEFKVIELDDVGHDDIGEETLRTRENLAGWDRFTITKTDPDGTIRGALAVDVDDGTYAAQLTVTSWDEQF